MTLEIGKEDRKDILSKIKKYIVCFIDKNSDYLGSLIEIFHGHEDIKKGLSKGKKYDLKNIFYRVIIFAIQQLNESGEKYILNYGDFFNNYSLNLFELAKSYYEKYLSEINTNLLEVRDSNNLNEQKNKS